MKKYLLAIMAVFTMMAFTGCDEAVGYIDGLTPEEKLIIKQALEITNGENGASAYEVAVENGFEGTEEEWLASLQGADGVDGVCPDCDAVVECPECPACPVEEVPVLPEGMVLMTFASDINLTGATVGHTKDGFLVSSAPADITELDGRFTVEANITAIDAGVHMFGLQLVIPEPDL